MCHTRNQLNNYTNRLLTLKKEKYIHFLQKKFWGADFADMQLISKFNKGFRFLLCVIDIFSKYEWLNSLKDKKVLQLLMLFKKSYMNLIANQTKYGEIKTVNFTIDQ